MSEIVTKPVRVDEQEIKELGGFVPLTLAERESLAKMLGIEVGDITQEPICRVVGRPVDGWIPNFPEVIHCVLNQKPDAHVLDGLREYFKAPVLPAPCCKGCVAMQNPKTGKWGNFAAYYPYQAHNW